MLFQLLILLIIVCYGFLAWKNLRLALVLLAGLLPTYLIRFTVGPIPSTLLEILILVCLIFWLIQKPNFKKLFRDLRPWILPLLLLLAAASFGVTVANDPVDALGIWKAYFVEPLLVLLMMFSVFKKNDWSDALRVLVLSGVVVSLLAILQVITGYGIPAPWDIELRVTSIFDYPNAVGLFLAPLVSLSAILLLDKPKTKLDRSLHVASVLLGSAAIVLAKTEAAMVVVPTALVVAFLFSSARPMLKWRITGEVVLVLGVLLLVVPPVSSKLLLQDYSGQVRLSQWSETMMMLGDHPAFGAGLNAYPAALEPYHDPTLYEIFQYPHNIFLNIWSELGLLGLFAFFWLAWLVLKSMHKQKATNLQLALFAALATMVIHGLVDVPYFKNDLSVMTMILLGALIASMSRKIQKQG